MIYIKPTSGSITMRIYVTQVAYKTSMQTEATS